MATTVPTDVFEALVARVSKLESDNKKMARQIKKLIKESEPEDKPKRVSGFAKPMKLSKALCKFLDVSEDHMMARTDVTKAITAYVKEHKLQNESNKRELILDDKLRTIIDAPEGTQVTFFNLQRYMSPHYVKEEPQVVKESAPVVKEEPPVSPVSSKVIKKVVKKKA